MADISDKVERFAAGGKRGVAAWRGGLLALSRVSTDIVAIAAASMIATAFYHAFFLARPLGRDEDVVIGIIGGILFVAIGHGRGLYDDERWDGLWQRAGLIAGIWLVVFAVLTGIGFLLKLSALVSRGSSIIFLFSGLALLVSLHALWPRLLRRCRESGVITPTHVALLTIGEDEASASLRRKVEARGQRIVQSWQVEPDRREGDVADVSREVLGRLSFHPFTELLIAAPARDMPYVQELSEALRLAPLRVSLLLDERLSWIAARPVRGYGTRLAVELSREPLGVFERLLKRGFDIAFASVALLLLSPLLVVVAIAIRIDTPGPVLFRQRRDGFNNQPFRIFKFRSMRVMEDGPSISQARQQDDRVTRIGRIIRRTSIDELPQLLNVLRGEMSIVGPRPHAVAHGEYYSRLIGEYAHRHHVKPGLTGWAQVNGSRGETQTVEHMRDRVGYDIWYIDHWSFWLDIRIIFRTIRHVAFERNAF